jgi:hypothetical protein
MKTSVKEDAGKTPQWDEDLVIDYQMESELEFQVFDREHLGSDKLIGEAKISIPAIFNAGGQWQGDVRLVRPNGNQAGVLNVQIYVLAPGKSQGHQAAYGVPPMQSFQQHSQQTAVPQPTYIQPQQQQQQPQVVYSQPQQPQVVIAQPQQPQVVYAQQPQVIFAQPQQQPQMVYAPIQGQIYTPIPSNAQTNGGGWNAHPPNRR